MKKSSALFSILVILSVSCSSPSKKICGDRIQFSSSEKIDFNANEKLLTCGDSSKQSWKEIPPSQSEYHLKTFLGARAFYRPIFEFKDNILYVDPGQRLVATSISYEGAPENFHAVRIRKIIDQPLNSELLNYVESSVIQRLKNIGYACPTIKVEAIKETGAIHVSMNPGQLYHFGKPKVDALRLYPETMRRFDAFSSGDSFRYEWIKLTENRAENDGIVISSQFTYTCPQNNSELDLQQILIGGDKRLLTIGVGASTEEIPIGQISWKQVRTDENGSNTLITLYGSHRHQRIKGTHFYHLFKNAPRFHWDPSIKFERKIETTYRSSEMEASFPFTYQWDYADDSLKISSGPALKRNFSDDAGISKALTLLSLSADINWFTHHYEFYMNDPQMGSSIEFNIEFLREINFNMLGTILKLDGIHLLPLNSVYPTQWILGFRYGANTTFVNESVTGINKIPAQYLHTLGGDQNIRGFSRNELSMNGIGVHTSVFGNLELRFAKTIKFGIEPFAFFDFGALGNASTSIDPRLYYSPGMGVRWQIPFGVIRTTLAHGYLAPQGDPALEHFQFFLSFGKEF